MMNSPEAEHTRRVVAHSFDLAYRARVNRAVEASRQRDRLSALPGHESLTTMAQRQEAEGMSDAERDQAANSYRGLTKDEFQRFARVLGVSAKWLAIGTWRDSRDGYLPPPASDTASPWLDFGTYSHASTLVEFHPQVDDGGMPMWERALVRQQVDELFAAPRVPTLSEIAKEQAL